MILVTQNVDNKYDNNGIRLYIRKISIVLCKNLILTSKTIPNVYMKIILIGLTFTTYLIDINFLLQNISNNSLLFTLLPLNI